jgi:glycosyltransferase involved in cell wall biosynthesis
MRILQIVHQYLPEKIGGTELYTRWLSQGLASRGRQISVFYRRDASGRGLNRRDEAGGVSVWAVRSGKLSPARRFAATIHEPHIHAEFCRVLAQVQPQLVHIQHLQGLPVSLVDHLQQRNIPFIITLHDFWWICANAQLLTNYDQSLCSGPQAFLNCARCALARSGHKRLWPAMPLLVPPLAHRNRLLQGALKSAARLIAPSNFVRRWYEVHGVPSGKLHEIPHGLETAGSAPGTRSKPTSKVRFTYIGGLSWQKGVHLVLEAFQNLPAGAELWIVGDDTGDPTYVTALKSLASGQVRFQGRQSRQQIWKTLSQTDVVVVPSLWYEAYAFVVSEAFAARVPVVASHIGTLADRVRPEVDGLLVPPGDVSGWRDALARFLQEPDLAPRLRAGIQPVKTLEDHVTEIDALYALILQETR